MGTYLMVRKPDRLLKDTLEGNSDAVAKAIQDVHETEYAPTWYNNERSLRYVVKMAYISCVDQYAGIQELPGGHGLADVAFLPQKRSVLPAMIVELKWNKRRKVQSLRLKQRITRRFRRTMEGKSF